MPRKAFIVDLGAASKQSCFANISNVKAGADDGELVFLYQPPRGASNAVQISALVVPDLADYPSHHDFHIFASENAPASVARALQKAPSFSGKALSEFLANLSSYLNLKVFDTSENCRRAADDDEDTEISDSQLDDALEDSDADALDNQDWVLEEDEFTQTHGFTAGKHTSGDARARADLKTLKDAGFKMGFLGNLSDDCSCYLSVACRIQKLGISEEASVAWDLNPSDYLILLMHYPHGYQSLDFFESVDSAMARSRLDMRVGVSKTYRAATFSEAKNAFKQSSDGTHHFESNTPALGEEQRFGFREIFISRPLNGLLNERLHTILKYRLAYGLSWSGSEKLYGKTIGTPGLGSDYIEDDESPEDTPPSLPQMVTADEILTGKSHQELSFPLLAMQFLLRHFVRCTEFCLVCFCRLDGQIEAIKPYVCDNPLCLYQYMNLGFGPSIEHEVVTQPFVVDLLVSFCYSAAAAYCLKQFPEGLGFRVPRGSQGFEFQMHHAYPTFQPQNQLGNFPPAKKAKTESTSASPLVYKCRFRQEPCELIFDKDAYPRCPVAKGDWIAISSEASKLTWHCRVSDIYMFPTVAVNAPVSLDINLTPAHADSLTAGSTPWMPVTLVVYNENFDNLKQNQMCDTIRMLLALLPSIDEMQQYLLKPGTSLSTWLDRISPAALGLLRWIIASNRSCIMQVDQPREYSEDKVKRQPEDRVQGTPSWLQFRFAMGAPDKEQRFLNALTNRSDNAYKSIFAWHGSPLHNWHSIIREGLHYNHTLHGRAHGHGCYHATDFHTSASYASFHRGSSSGTQCGTWPNSILQISSAVALSEIVNAPKDFVSQQPYYVVSQLDWIQTRYLFVLPCAKDIIIEEDKPLVNVLKQDPDRTPKGPKSTPIVLPITAIAKSRRPGGSCQTARTTVSSSGKLQRFKQKLIGSPTVLDTLGAENTIVDDDDTASVDTHPEDLEILLEPNIRSTSPPALATKPQTQPSTLLAVTDFVIRSIPDLPLMPNPKYATSSASRRLLKDYRNLQATQASHIKTGKLPDLGWYSNPEHMEQTGNLYQWIVELHSFPLSLPLATDMKGEGIQSIVLEIRFHASFPFSPPFVRVVRPRFVPFQNGGGGHVTAGGSICMDLLTSSGWTAVSDIESVLLQIRMAIMSKDPRPARLQRTSSTPGSHGGDYSAGDAVDAFKRAARAHGWVVPDTIGEVI